MTKTRRLNLITVSDYLFAVSNEPCELNELCLHDEPNKGYELAYYGQGVINPLKIEGHLLLAKDSELPINKNLLPPLEQEDDYVYEDGYNVLSHKRGYDKAKEKYKYTEEDIYKAIQYGREVHYTNDQPFIQSLSQPKMPIAFECEVEELFAEDGKTKVGEDLAVDIIEGFTAYLSGKYIYE